MPPNGKWQVSQPVVINGDPTGNRTPVTGVRGLLLPIEIITDIDIIGKIHATDASNAPFSRRFTSGFIPDQAPCVKNEDLTPLFFTIRYHVLYRVSNIRASRKIIAARV